VQDSCFFALCISLLLLTASISAMRRVLAVILCAVSIIIFLGKLSIWATATEIKWTPGKDDPNDKAASAPKSQRYWDEHGIEKPDYAKTDSEVAQEKLAKGGSKSPPARTLGLWVAFVAASAVGVFYLRKHGGAGSRLGGRPGGFRMGQLSGKEARRARLAHFEAANPSKAE
jgi:hypothetical protein